MKISTKRKIAEAVGWLSWLLSLGMVGGMERGAVSLGAGAAWAFGLLILGAAAMYKAGLFTKSRTAAPSIVAIAAACAIVSAGFVVFAL